MVHYQVEANAAVQPASYGGISATGAASANISAIKGAVGGAIGGFFAKINKRDGGATSAWNSDTNADGSTSGASASQGASSSNTDPESTKPQPKPSDKVEKSELFESKHVKSIIETFQSVLTIIEEQERDINQFIGEQDDLNDQSDDDEFTMIHSDQ